MEGKYTDADVVTIFDSMSDRELIDNCDKDVLLFLYELFFGCKLQGKKFTKSRIIDLIRNGIYTSKRAQAFSMNKR